MNQESPCFSYGECQPVLLPSARVEVRNGKDGTKSVFFRSNQTGEEGCAFPGDRFCIGPFGDVFIIGKEETELYIRAEKEFRKSAMKRKKAG